MLNRKIYFLFIAFFFIPLFVFSEEKPVDPASILTLKKAILTAFKNNLDIQVQEKEILVSRANILDATSKFLPHINLDGGYTYNDKVPVPQNMYTGYQNDNTLGLNLNQSVFKGGENIANFKQAKLGLQSSEETLRAKKLDIEFEAKRLYYGLLLAFETLRIAQETLDQSKAHLAEVTQMYEQGTASRFDLLQSQVQVSLLQPDVVKAENDISSIKADLNKLLGQQIDSPVRVEEKLGYESIAINEAEFLQTAYLYRPEMRLKALGVDISKWSVQMAKAGYLPQVDVNANYYYRSNNTADIFNERHRNWNAGLALHLPVFEGFSTKAKVDSAKAKYAQAKLDKDNIADQTAVDVRTACLNLRKSESIISSQKDNVDEAREALRLSEVSYRAGVATNLDVLDSEVSLSQIQTNLVSAIYDYLMAEASLYRTMGKQYALEEGSDEKKN